MHNLDTLTDPKRTVPAGKLGTQVHRVRREKNRRFVTACGEAIRKDDLLILLQRPEDINCPECREAE